VRKFDPEGSPELRSPERPSRRSRVLPAPGHGILATYQILFFHVYRARLKDALSQLTLVPAPLFPVNPLYSYSADVFNESARRCPLNTQDSRVLTNAPIQH